MSTDPFAKTKALFIGAQEVFTEHVIEQVTSVIQQYDLNAATIVKDEQDRITITLDRK